MSRRASLAVVVLAAAAITVAGWREFLFLTDDAFIAFRYASNAIAGRGLVWNPPPFLPVEGYTSFLWVALLHGIWRVTGIEPPDAANPVSLLCALVLLALVLRFAARMRLRALGAATPAVAMPRLALAAIALGIALNRTFLVWTSSGLETALFSLCFTGWVLLALAPPALRTQRAIAALSVAAAAAALARPDGWLAVAGSFALLGLDLRARGRPTLRRALAWLPLALPFAHLLWRRGFYGEWLPNTYHAKHLGAWPQAGVRYAASFVLEYGLWLWIAAAAFAFARACRLRRLPAAHVAIAVAVPAAHFAYYTLIVGGDHFEYRVYAHLVPLLFVSFAWLVAAAGLAPHAVAAATGLLVALSLPIPWVHHWITRDLDTREATHELVAPVAPHLPLALRPPARAFDRLQAWLIPRHIGMRHREHAVYLRTLEQLLPTREQGSRIGWEGRPVMAAGNVGLLGWVLPNVAILDQVGLNDWVVARTPPPDDGQRMMAHDRVAPPAYLACFQPNVTIAPGRRVIVVERPVPLTDADIVACERTWRARAGQPIEVPPGWRGVRGGPHPGLPAAPAHGAHPAAGAGRADAPGLRDGAPRAGGDTP